MSELPHPATADPTRPVLRLVEWIASDPESGVLRLRGELPGRDPARAGSPVLVLRDESGTLTQRAPLNDDGPGADGWRAAYLIAGALLGGAVEKWLEWPDGTRLALPDVDVSTGDGRVPVPPPERGAEVFDRAVLAERRAQRAESAQRAQARTAEAAVAALGALERRVEELTRERDALAAARDERDATGGEAPAPVRLVPAPEPADPGADLAGDLEAERAARLQAERDERRQRQALDEALGTLGRLRVQVAEMRLRMRTQMASSSADGVRLAVLESERRGFRGRLQDLRGELDALRGRLAGEQSRSRHMASELDSARSRVEALGAERDELAAALAGERQARARIEEELRSERAAAQALGARASELESALAEAEVRVGERAEMLRSRFEELSEQLRAERSARASLRIQLRVARASGSAARAEAAARTAAQSKLRREHDRALAEAAAAREQLAAWRALAREQPASPAAPVADDRSQRRLAELEAELHDTRGRLQAAQQRLRSAATAAAGPASAPPVPVDPPALAADPTPGEPQSVEPPRPALSPEVAARLRGRIAAIQDAARPAPGEQQSASVAETENDSAGLAARLDAAAAALRAAAPLAAGEEGAAPVVTGEVEPVPADAPASGAPTSMALTVRPASEMVATPGRSTGTGVAGADGRSGMLRGALVRLAIEDPFTAARLLAALLPAQGAFLREDVDYDITIRELGTFAVTVSAGATSVRALQRPRPRRQAQMHVTVHALTLAELLAGRERRVGRLLSPVRVRGSRRPLEALSELARTSPGLAEVARAGGVVEPALAIRVLPHLVSPVDTDGHSFTIAHELRDEAPRTWYVTADGRRGLRVSDSPPDGGCDARVTLSRATYERLMRADALDSEHKPWVRGDFAAVETLRRWIDAARS